ncbi:M10 family metallopeptidase [Pseudoroseomonas cervicalis]|uniref:Type I secretion target GGXGXDXXX repeat (2 copies) n=1 Tax=Pseudoroseomonas cervicalis ATCC 49957 TaxID=525371 RepID=D5RJT4_9PROT|nr:M10 family metallopeptidase [Pseudoroseomonas cervicalis]EFH12438.1 type I secretion target GGXGXDXXX repeat (2 copies) [Pseudoroseomonas cervicalis ATCC 49957]
MTAYNPLTGITWNASLSHPDVRFRLIPGGLTLNLPLDQDEDGNYIEFRPIQTEAWNTYERAQLLQVFELYQAITNLTFTEVDTESEADFHLLLGDLPSLEGATPAAIFNPPVGGELDGYGMFNIIPRAWSREPGGRLDQGGSAFQTLIHEIGHGLGLAHPHDDGGGSTVFPGVEDSWETGEFDLNQGVWTMMSYVRGWATGPDGPPVLPEYGHSMTPMAFDIAVLQARYGANTTYATGDDIYELWDTDGPGTGYAAIWDAGGDDAIRYSGARDAVVDLRAATLEWAPGGGGFVSYVSGVHGGYTIAHGVVIEVALLGAGNDRITGNDADNLFFGGSGNDMIDGGGGRNAAGFTTSFTELASFGRYGNTVILDGPEGQDTLVNIHRLMFADGTIELDRGSPLVDPLHYYFDNRDVWLAGMNAEEHFASYGWREGRDPNFYFSVSSYLAVNQDVAAAGLNPLEHYLDYGWREGRDPSAWFDTDLYLARNPDVAAAGLNPLLHYLTYGQNEQRSSFQALGKEIRDGFDAEFYLLANPDVARAGIDARQHYEEFGWREERSPNGWFSTEYYLDMNPDVAAAGINPLAHYHTDGWREGRDPSPLFETGRYLANNPDVAAAGIDPLEHYLRFGLAEGRDAPF